MKPGTYLEKRRIMAGYSLSSLARELLMLTGFGSARLESDFRRLRMRLISAEQGSLHHDRERIELIRAFVPLDTALYLHLVACERSGDPYRVEGLCRNCACSFHSPCIIHVGPTAALGESACHPGDGICSACEYTLGSVSAETWSTRRELRELGERIDRFNQAAAARDAAERHREDDGQPFIRLVPNTGEH